MSDRTWEVEIKVRRRGLIFRWEKAMGSTPVEAFDNVANDIRLDLQEYEDGKGGSMSGQTDFIKGAHAFGAAECG